MANSVKITYVARSEITPASLMEQHYHQDTLVLFCGAGLEFSDEVQKLIEPIQEQIHRAAKANKFKGKKAGGLEILAPNSLSFSKVLILGTATDSPKGKKDLSPASVSQTDLLQWGGVIRSRIECGNVLMLLDFPSNIALSAEEIGQIILGLRLRSYRFNTYKTKIDNDDHEQVKEIKVTAAVDNVKAASAVDGRIAAVAEGVYKARDLVNEPPNVLFPEVFANRLKKLEEIGVEVEILGKKDLEKLGMGALLAVGQGALHEARVAVMRWRGGKHKDGHEKHRPIALVGKGVCFDSGGISIKPAANMEDMKGDMAGAACVAGLMCTLALRKAKVDVIGIVGLVENMPSGDAYRPGDILTSLSGQTIEVINTDAEGRLVLADILWYVSDKYKPRLIVDLATLTGAIFVTFGQEIAGLFSNDDELATHLTASGEATGERVWRLPLGPAFDKMIDSKFADMKNAGGRYAGSITAAQFLQRFVKETPWAHLDIAGTAMASTQSDINQSWGSGWGVRLLDHFIKNHCEP